MFAEIGWSQSLSQGARYLQKGKRRCLPLLIDPENDLVTA
jgi:hypothetical protein